MSRYYRTLLKKNLLLFDENTDDAVGYGLFLLRTGHQKLVRARAYNGDSDQGEADVLADNNTLTLTSPITNLNATATGRGLTENHTFGDLIDNGGSNYDAFIPKLFDHGLNGYDLSESTKADQPRIATAGAILTENGKPKIECNGTSHGIKSAAINKTVTSVSLFLVQKTDSFVGDRNVFRCRSNGGYGAVSGFSYENRGNSNYGVNTFFDDGTGDAVRGNDQGVANTSQRLQTLIYKPSEISTFVNGSADATLNTVASGSVPIGTVSLNSAIWLGKNYDSNARFYDGSFQTIAAFFTDQSSNRSEIETVLNDNYGVY